MGKQLEKLISDTLAIEADNAKDAGALGYMARALVQATIPHSKPRGNEFKRQNGRFKLTLLADSEIGLPYGSIPRLLLAWIATEAVRKQSRTLLLGNTLSDFMEELDLVPSGGRWGTITRLKEQMKRLFSCSISCQYSTDDKWIMNNVTPVKTAELWWDTKQPGQANFFESTLTLGSDFFEEIIQHPVPVDLRVLKTLKRSPLALDIYCWSTYRVSYLAKKTTIPWATLKMQFGSNYTADAQGLRNFKKHFLKELNKVCCIFNGLDIEANNLGLVIKPSSTHIKVVGANLRIS